MNGAAFGLGIVAGFALAFVVGRHMLLRLVNSKDFWTGAVNGYLASAKPEEIAAFRNDVYDATTAKLVKLGRCALCGGNPEKCKDAEFHSKPIEPPNDRIS